MRVLLVLALVRAVGVHIDVVHLQVVLGQILNVDLQIGSFLEIIGVLALAALHE